MNVAPLSPPDNIRKFSIKKVELGFVCPRIHCASKLGLFSWADTFFFLFLPSSLRAWPGSDDPCLIDVFDVPPKFLPPLASKKGARRGMRSRAGLFRRALPCLPLPRAGRFLPFPLSAAGDLLRGLCSAPSGLPRRRRQEWPGRRLCCPRGPVRRCDVRRGSDLFQQYQLEGKARS